MAATSLRLRMRAGVLAITVVTGCTHTVEPPSGVDQPATVILLDHGRTSSIVLPQDGSLVRYAYGEWDWYARNRTGVVRASGALFSASEGALGRRVLDAEPDLTAVRDAVRVPVESAWSIDVPASRAHALAARLDAQFERRSDEAVENPRVALRLVPHAADYSLGHNSNHMTASWLRRMECRVDTDGPWSRWRVLSPDAD